VPETDLRIQHRGEAYAQAHLALLRSREALVGTRTKLVNHVRGTVKSFGSRLPKCNADSFHRKLRDHVPDALAPALDSIFETIASLTARIRGYARELEAVSRELYPQTALLRQVGGVGPLTALAFVPTVEDPSRFGTSRSVGAYLGLTPGQHQSGDSDPQERISKRGDELLRKLLVQGAHYVLGPFAPESDLRRHGLKIAERGGKKYAKERAVVAVARKLSVLLHRLWVTGVVCTQMTKTDVLAARIGGDHVPDLHLVVGDDHPVDQELRQPTPLLEGGVGQSPSRPSAEILHGTGHAG
jgi:transposase